MDDLSEKVKKDSLKSGFPTELIVESTFRKMGWEVSGNTYFIDQDEDKGREIDIRAHTVKTDMDVSPKIFCWSMLSVEIKKSDKPWVIFSSKRNIRERGLFKILSHLHNTGKELNRSFFEKLHPAMSLERIGRTSQVAFIHNTATIFSAVVGATKAAIDDHRAAEDHGEVWDENSIDAVFYEPIVIVDGQLFECYLDSKGSMECRGADILQYGLHYASPNYKAKQYLIDIVALPYLEEYLRQREKWLNEMYDSIYSKIKNNA